MVKGRMEAWTAGGAGEGGIARLDNFNVALGSAMNVDLFAEIQAIIGKDKSHWITVRPIICRDSESGEISDDGVVV
ncbi:hypothetical protein FRB93_009343 [Tulasnella sp. JGI-2019a]|nr:hypothetical protein FRB93_009343 [Tulasnella sp. JGI-2019a]